MDPEVRARLLKVFEAAKSGDRKAWDKIVEQVRGQVFDYVLPICRNKADAEDIVQDTFLRAYRAINRLEEASKFVPWIMVIARNTVFERLRRPTLRFVDQEETAIASCSDTPVIAAVRNESRQDVRDCVERLTENHRKAIERTVFESMTLEDAAEDLGEPRSSLGRWKNKALEALQRCLESKGHGTDYEIPN